LRDVVLAGLTVLLPVLATLLVVIFSVEFLSGLLDPVAFLVAPITSTSTVGVKLLAVAALGALVLLVGFVVDRYPGSDGPKRHVDSAIASLPVVGSIYASFLDVSEAFLGADTGEFESVKLVEMDEPDMYAIAFRTSETPPAVHDASGCADLVTLFVPSAPNPLIGGDVLYVTADRVEDVDMTVEEGLRAVLTSGTADDSGRYIDA
jgi:uncharacterized membrane protein